MAQARRSKMQMLVLMPTYTSLVQGSFGILHTANSPLQPHLVKDSYLMPQPSQGIFTSEHWQEAA
jgi:hypothetical protein